MAKSHAPVAYKQPVNRRNPAHPATETHSEVDGERERKRARAHAREIK